MKKIMSSIVGIGLCLTAGSSFAALYTFDFDLGYSSNTYTSGSVSFTSSDATGITLGLTAYAENSVASSPATLGYGADYGLTIISEGIDNNHQIDGYDPNERVAFEFGEDVVIESIVFGEIDNWDEFELWTSEGSNSTSWGAFAMTDWISDGEEGIVNYDFSDTYVSSYFAIGATDQNDNFNIRSLTVSSPAAPVPEPSTMILFGAGLLGLAGVSRRRNRK